ncbi:mycofactocin oligosaccharide methyltransferase MftM [Gordonia sp. NPDC003429]
MSSSAVITSTGAPSTTVIRVRRRAVPPAGFTSSGALAWRRTPPAGLTPAGVDIVHRFGADTISDDVMVSALVGLVEAGALTGQWEFEEAAVGLIRSAAANEDAAWAAFYENSLRDLRSGHAQFAPVHRRARTLLRGTGVLEVGCCFGLLALQCAEDGYDVCAYDISPGAIGLLDAAARRRGVDVNALVGDARSLPLPDRSVDTVTLIHLLEHLDPADVPVALDEALRVARRRVVVAVPFEDRPSEHFGHLTRLGEEDLLRWAGAVRHGGATTFADHGGWLVLTPASLR